LGLYELNLETLETRRLVPDMSYCTDPSYSPKGDRIVFSARQGGTFDIYSVQANGGGLLRHTFGEGRNEHPAVSPDGRLVAFDSTRGGVRQVYLLNLKTGDVTRVSRSRNEESQPAWRKR
jgi:TolB protein